MKKTTKTETKITTQERLPLTTQWVVRQKLCSALILFCSSACRDSNLRTRFLKFREAEVNLRVLSRLTPACALKTISLVREVVAIGAFCGEEARRPQTPAESARTLAFLNSCDLALQAYEEYSSDLPDPVPPLEEEDVELPF